MIKSLTVALQYVTLEGPRSNEILLSAEAELVQKDDSVSGCGPHMLTYCVCPDNLNPDAVHISGQVWLFSQEVKKMSMAEIFS